MKNMVISLGGSVLIPDTINFNFLEKFKKKLRKNYKNNKFVIVCGGGSIARKYISALRAERKSEKELSLAGIRVTRLNALFLMQFFGKEANDSLPLDMKNIRSNLHKNKVVICGALHYEDNSTSDSTAAKLAHYLKTDLINITNVPGLFTADPKKDKKAKIIQFISWKDFHAITNKIKFAAGQHFVLDQKASILIKKDKIKTYIIGPSLNNLENIIKNKKFKGTTIYG